MMGAVFAVAGQIGGGKTTIAHLLGQYLRAPVVAFSSALRELAIEAELLPSRENLQDLGSKIVESSPQILCNRVLQKAGSAEDLVIDGLRHKVIAETLITLIAPKHLVIVYVDAAERTRRQRVLAETGRDALPGWESHSSERYVTELRALADGVISNDSTLQDVHAQVHALLAQIGRGPH